MVRKTDEISPVVTLLQGYLAQASLPADGRLPPERHLASELGLPRALLRRALEVLEADGVIWRHVGKGTFFGTRPVSSIGDVVSLTRQADVAVVMEARLVLEPELARLAALRRGPDLGGILQATMERSRRSGLTWREYEAQDARLHREIAEAAGNVLLLQSFDQIAAVRRALTWARLRDKTRGPSADHHSFADHARIVAAILAGDPAGAAEAMRDHIGGVAARL